MSWMLAQRIWPVSPLTEHRAGSVPAAIGAQCGPGTSNGIQFLSGLDAGMRCAVDWVSSEPVRSFGGHKRRWSGWKLHAMSAAGTGVELGCIGCETWGRLRFFGLVSKKLYVGVCAVQQRGCCCPRILCSANTPWLCMRYVAVYQTRRAHRHAIASLHNPQQRTTVALSAHFAVTSGKNTNSHPGQQLPLHFPSQWCTMCTTAQSAS